VAANCLLCPPSREAVVGKRLMEIGTRVTVEVSDFVESATAVAVMVTVAGLGTTAGAV
jgi:hypothetical protein